jgi:hypothetical protein
MNRRIEAHAGYTLILKKSAFAYAQATRSESKIDYAETEKPYDAPGGSDPRQK